MRFAGTGVINEADRVGIRRAVRRGGAGFTLIELLVVVSILAAVIGTIGACLTAGLRVWDMVRSFNVLENDAMLDLNLMERDLRNAFTVYAIGFEGTETEVSVPGFVTVDDVRRIGVVGYRYDRDRRALLRTERDWPSGESHEERVIGNVDALTLTYSVETSGENEAVEFQEMGSPVTNFPDRIQIVLSLGNRSRTIDIARHVLLPIRGR